MRNLHLTSPLTRGDDVTHAQRHLAGQNHLRVNYQPGPIDGVYGPATMRAAKRAKFWLGYPTRSIDGAYGDILQGLLMASSLPADYQARRTARLKAKPATPLRALALAEAGRHVGVKESPAGSNHVLFSDWYGITGPWCAMFVTYCYAKAGSTAFKRGSRYAFVPFVVHDARAGLNHLALTMQPEPGDLVCFDWDKDGTADHIGLYHAPAGTHFTTIEGNTSLGNNSNGGEVMRRERDRSEVQAFVRVTR